MKEIENGRKCGQDTPTGSNYCKYHADEFITIGLTSGYVGDAVTGTAIGGVVGSVGGGIAGCEVAEEVAESVNPDDELIDR